MKRLGLIFSCKTLSRSAVGYGIDVSVGETSGDSDATSCWVTREYGTLCGRGEISIESFPGPGEEEGSGGVVTFSNGL